MADDSAQIRRARHGDLRGIVALFADDEASSFAPQPAAASAASSSVPPAAVPPAAGTAAAAPQPSVPHPSEHGILGPGQVEAFAAIADRYPVFELSAIG